MQKIYATLEWISADYQTNSFRFIVEVVACALSIGCSIVMALTVPNPPLLELYIVWISGCLMYTWSAWTRGSFGMLANYLALVVIDIVGLVRIIIS